MTWDDPAKFPKNRGGFSGLGRAKAKELDKIDVPYLRRRVPGAQAIKKGEFLYVVKDQPATIYDPFLWSSYVLRVSGSDYVYGVETPTRTQMLPRVNIWSVAPLVSTVERVYTIAQPLFVGAGYTFSISVADGSLWHDEPRFPDEGRYFGRLTNVRYQPDGITGSLSLGAGNVPGANISFIDHDAPLVSPFAYGYVTQCTAFNSGWNAAAGGYGFGMVGFQGVEPAGSTRRILKCYYGSTADRIMASSTVMDFSTTGGTPQLYLFGGANVIGPGQIAIPRLQTTPIPECAFALMRSNDHGATWTEQLLPELEPYVLRQTNPEGGAPLVGFSGDEITSSAAFPMGGGRVGLIVLTAKQLSTVYSAEDMADANNRAPSLTCWRFFISDTTGHNFSNRPWPLDTEDGVRLSQNSWNPARPIPTYAGLHPAVEYGMAGMNNASMSAGPGSFFMSVGTWTDDPVVPATGVTTFNTRTVRMLWTDDYGDTWAFSDVLPADALSAPANPDTTSRSFCIATVVCARAKTATFDGELYVQGIAPLSVPGDGGETWRQSVFKTTAKFAAFTPAINLSFPGSDLGPYAPEWVPGYMPAPIYVGSTVDPKYPPRLRPGFPEFEKPA